MDIRSWNKTFVNLVCDWDGAECKSKEKNADNLKYFIVHIDPDPSFSFTSLCRNLRKLEKSDIFFTKVFFPTTGLCQMLLEGKAIETP